MLMDLSAPIESGDEVSITLSCAGGGTSVFTAVAKPFDGAAEDYQPGMGASASPTAG
jgi:copper(I)-binding protein